MNLELIAACLISFVIILAASIFFRRRQNTKARMGGAISLAKTYWLAFVLAVWFLWPLFILTLGDPTPVWRQAWTLFSGLIWLRALVELFMLTVTKNWRPPHGYLSHLATAICMLVFSALNLERLSEPTFLILWALCLFTILLDAYYAFRFHQIVQDKTVGAEGIWFASDEEPRFMSVNVLTSRMNILISIWALGFLFFLLWP